MKNSFIPVLILVLAMISACQEASEKRASETDAASLETVEPPISAPGDGEVGAPLAELQGTWATSCDALDDSGVFIKITELISAATLVRKVAYYSDSTCSAMTYELKASFTIAAAGQAALPAGAKKINRTLKTATLTPKTAALANEYNASRYCGIKDWAAQLEKSIVGKACDSDDPENILVAGQITYDIYEMNGSKKRLGSLMDDTHDGTSEAKRPTLLDAGTVYTRVVLTVSLTEDSNL